MNIASAKEQIKYAVEAYLARDEDGEYKIALSRQRPILLIGAPGIGKTAIMEQIAGELSIGLVSYSMTHHTRQSALGLPLIATREYGGETYEVSEYTMSEIIATIYDVIEKSGVREGILFLDEVNCVSETLSPSMLQFLQFKTFGRHKVPDGWVIVTAGNPPEYNRSVHEFDIVTLDRVKKIEVEPDFEAWRHYAYGIGVHEAVMSFLEARPERFYAVERGLTGKEFVTARSWVDLSEMIRLHEEMGFPVDVTLVSQYVQLPDVAEEFALYYELFNRYRDEYGIEGILAGTYEQSALERLRDAGLDERLSLVALLLDASGSLMRRAGELEDDIAFLREHVRDVRERMGRGGSVHGLLAETVEKLRAELDAKREAGSLSDEYARSARFAIRELRGAQSAVNAQVASGAEAFALVEQAYAGRVAELKDVVQQASSALSNVFSFIECGLGDGAEMVVLVTELTVRPHSSRFISEYGCEEYFAHNDDLLVSEREDDIKARIEKLGLDESGGFGVGR